MVGVRSALGRMEARAVLRLLLRVDDMSPVLYMETVYFASHADPALDRQVGRSSCTSACRVELKRWWEGGVVEPEGVAKREAFFVGKTPRGFLRLLPLRPTYQQGLILIHWSFRSQAVWDGSLFWRSATFRASGCLGVWENLRRGVCLVPGDVFPLPLAHLLPICDSDGPVLCPDGCRSKHRDRGCGVTLALG